MRDPLIDWPRFVQEVWQRMNKGQAEYGDRSFNEHPARVVREMKEEAADIAGWGYILWQRLDKIERALRNAEEKPETD